MFHDEVRRGPLGNAQRYEWWKFQAPQRINDRWNSNPTFSLAIPPGVDVDQVVAALAAVVRRHEALRTTFGFDADGEPFQVVHLPYLPHLRQHETGGDPDSPADEATGHFLDSVWYHDFDIAREFPMAAGVVLTGGKPQYIAMGFPHVVSDGTSVAIVRDELEEHFAAAAGGAPAEFAPLSHQPIDAAVAEASSRGRSASDKALAYWAGELSKRPNRMFAGAAERDVTTTSLWWISDTAPAVFEEVAQRFGTTTARVYTACMHVVLNILAGGSVSVVRSHFSGRTNPHYSRTVGCFASQLTTSVDYTDQPSLSEVISRVHASAVNAQMRSRYDYFGYRELEARAERSRGLLFGEGCVVNFREGFGSPPDERLNLHPRVPVVEGSGPLRDLIGFEAYISVTWKDDAAEVFGTFNDNIFSVPQMKTVLEFPELLLERFLRHGDVSHGEMAALVPPVRAPIGEWLSPRTVHVPSVTRSLIAAHPDVAAASLGAEEGRLTAYVVTRSGKTEPRDLREHVLARLRPWIPAVCPENFVLCAAAPADPDDADAWARAVRIREGAGRGTRGLPENAPERSLVSATAQANGLDEVNLDLSYVEAGGRMQLIPQVLRHLTGSGYTGLAAGDFLRPVSLRTAAAELRPVQG